MTVIWNLVDHGSSLRHQAARPRPSIRAPVECTLVLGLAVCFGILCYVVKCHFQEQFAFSGVETVLAVLIGVTMYVGIA